jgi:hypothetical protein
MTGFARRIGMGLVALALWCGTTAAQGWQHLGKVQRVDKLKDGVELTAGAAKVRVTAFRNGVFRVRLAPNGSFAKDHSWAVIESADPPQVLIGENQKEVQIIANSLVANIRKSPLLITFSRLDGLVYLADEPSLPMAPRPRLEENAIGRKLLWAGRQSWSDEPP